MRFLWISRDLPLLADNGARIYSNGLIGALLGAGAVGSLICYSNGDECMHNVPGLTIIRSSLAARDRALRAASRR